VKRDGRQKEALPVLQDKIGVGMAVGNGKNEWLSVIYEQRFCLLRLYRRLIAKW
jgi:hypothetical protein